MKFYNYINEFKKGIDFDNPGKTRSVIIFDKKDDYKIQGKTHGLISHGIKHGPEFFPEEYNDIINKIITYLKDKKYYVYTNGKIDDVRVNDKKIIINTLDRINDKRNNSIKLTDDESFIFDKFLVKIKDLYYQALMDFEKESVDISKIVKMDNNLFYKNIMAITNKKEKVYFNLNTLFFAVNKIGSGPKTFFKYKTLNDLKKKLHQQDFINNDVLRDLIKI